MLVEILLFYAMVWVAIIWHEAGHFGDKIQYDGFHWLIFPAMSTTNPRFRYGGLVANVIIFTSIWYFKITNPLLLYIGLASYLHFIIYSTVSVFYNDPTADVEYRNYLFLIPVGMALFGLWSFYIPILMKIFGG